jgi:hypothetical protein
MVRSADERVWQRYMHVLDEAHGLGLNPTPLRLPVKRSVLVGQGRGLMERIEARKAEVAGGIA